MTKTPIRKTITKAIVRGACLATLAGFGLAVTPGTARAEFITFTVNETAVPGTINGPFTADLLNGGYTADLILNPDGTWTESATATFSAYFLGGDDVEGALIGDLEPGGYTILGTLESSGTYVNDTCGPFSCIVFIFEEQTGTLGLDGNQDNVAEIPLVTASGVGAGTGGIIVFTGGPTGGTGSFVSNFAENELALGIASIYWPTLATIQFVTTISGDINELDLPTVEGDVSVQFTQVPEPATLTLLGLGLFGLAGAARRRRATKA